MQNFQMAFKQIYWLSNAFLLSFKIAISAPFLTGPLLCDLIAAVVAVVSVVAVTFCLTLVDLLLSPSFSRKREYFFLAFRVKEGKM